MSRTLILFQNFLSREAKAAISIPPSSHEVITGMVLSDAHISKHSTTGISRLIFRQKDREFIQFLWDIFNEIGIVGAAPRTYNYFDKHTGNTYTIHSFDTYALSQLGVLRSEWYTLEDGKSVKHLPFDIGVRLTPVAIAFWLAGEGHYVKDQGVDRISTDSFSIDEVQYLQAILLERYNISSTLSSAGAGKEQYRIRIAKASMPTLQSLVGRGPLICHQ